MAGGGQAIVTIQSTVSTVRKNITARGRGGGHAIPTMQSEQQKWPFIVVHLSDAYEQYSGGRTVEQVICSRNIVCAPLIRGRS